MKKISIVVASAALLATSCSERVDNSIPYLTLECHEECAPKDIFEDIDLIALKKDGEPFVDGISSIRDYGDIFIAQNNERTIYAFDSDGNYISDSNSVIGHGHGEYDNPIGYGFNPFSKTIEVLTPFKMLVYNLDFKFVKAVKLPYRYNDNAAPNIFFDNIHHLSDNISLLLPLTSTEKKIYVYDILDEKTISKIDYSEDILIDISMQDNSFIRQDSTLLFCPTFVGRYIYEFDADKLGINPKFRIEEVDLNLRGNEEDNSEYLLNTTEEIPIRYLCAGETSFLLTKTGDSLDNLNYIVYDSNYPPKKMKLKKDGVLQLPLLASSQDESLYGITDEYRIGELFDAMDMECPDSIAMYPNIIVKYSVKDWGFMP